MRSLRLVICALAFLALLIPLAFGVFADGTGTEKADADTDVSEPVATDALTADDAASVDPDEYDKWLGIAFGYVGRSLSYRFSEGDTDGSFRLILIACVAACVFVPYFLGSINFSIIVSKIFHREDIRSYGSGNAGATNMLRTYGKRDAALAFCGDVLKCVASVSLGRVLLGLTGGYIALFCCIVGHAFPVYYKFKGGKGVAAAAGGVAALYAFTPRWWIILVELGVFVVIVAITRFISLGSVTAMFIFPILVSRFYIGWSLNILIAFMCSALVVFLHRENIKRIYKGTESKFTLKKTDKHEKEE